MRGIVDRDSHAGRDKDGADGVVRHTHRIDVVTSRKKLSVRAIIVRVDVYDDRLLDDHAQGKIVDRAEREVGSLLESATDARKVGILVQRNPPASRYGDRRGSGQGRVQCISTGTGVRTGLNDARIP